MHRCRKTYSKPPPLTVAAGEVQTLSSPSPAGTAVDFLFDPERFQPNNLHQTEPHNESRFPELDSRDLAFRLSIVRGKHAQYWTSEPADPDSSSKGARIQADETNPDTGPLPLLEDGLLWTQAGHPQTDPGTTPACHQPLRERDDRRWWNQPSPRGFFFPAFVWECVDVIPFYPELAFTFQEQSAVNTMWAIHVSSQIKRHSPHKFSHCALHREGASYATHPT
jgi:hypothetical protein